MPRAVVFDCDGVLVDSEPAWFTGIVGTFQRHGVCQLLTGPASSLYGGSVGDVVALLEREMGEPLEADKVAREIYEAILAAIAEGVPPMRGALELLEAVRGTRPLAVASNGSMETVEASMRAASIPAVFDAIVALEPPLRPKPAPDLYLRACERLGVAPARAIAVEDSVLGAKAARAGGLDVVGVGRAPGLEAVVDMAVPDLFDPRLWDLLELENLER
ncbi:MAG: HAD family phosphatase [Acidimicrobiales bacterium]